MQSGWGVRGAAVGGAAMRMSGGRWGLRGVSLLAHALFGILAAWFISRLGAVAAATESQFGLLELTILSTIVIGFATSFGLPGQQARGVYRIAAHVAFLLWIAGQFVPMDLGQEFISVTWGLYGIALLLLSFRLEHRGVQLAGLTTLGIVAGKLLLIDMAQVDVVWRILLFMGFGAAFLGLSYLINRHSKAA